MKRLTAILLVLASLLGVLPLAAFAASSEEEALGEVDIYNSGQTLSYVCVNGRLQKLTYVYFKYTRPDGSTREIPAYCVNPTTDGVAQVVDDGKSVKYLAKDRASDPKIMGIISNGYPGRSLAELGLDNICQAYCATKLALWCYLLSSWDISKLTPNPALSGAEAQRAQRIIASAKDIYQRGIAWTDTPSPRLIVTADTPSAIPMVVDGQEYLGQSITVQSETPVGPAGITVGFADPSAVPAGTRIVDESGKDVDNLEADEDGKAHFRVLYPKDSVEGQSGSVQLEFGANVRRYAAYYAVCAEKNQYGNLQNYICDVDPYTYAKGNVLSAYGDETTPENPDEPDDPQPPEEPQGGTLRIIKVESGTEIPLAGAIFEVVDPDGQTIGSFSTDGSGTIELPVTKDGNYTVYERQAPEYHLLGAMQAQNVTVAAGAEATVTFANDPYGNLRVEKYSDTGEKLPGAVIQVRHIESGTVYSQQTNEAGAAFFEQLKPGAYEIVEQTAPAGYRLDATPHNVAVVSGETAVVPMINEELPGLRIIKYDRKTLETLSGVIFAIWKDGELLGDFQTNLLGEIVLPDLQPGTYRAYEVETGDDGHILSTTPQEVELSAGDGIRELVFFNEQKPGLHLVKVDSSDLSKPIANAKFRFEAVDGSWGPLELTTLEDGTIDLSKLPTGAVVVTELECPGYVIDDGQRIVELKPNENQQFVFTNSRLPSLRLIKTSSDGKPLAGVSFRLSKIEDNSRYLDRTTTASGEILWEGLEPGVYSLREIATDASHILDLREYHVELFPGKVSEICLENQRRPSLVIRKTDAETGQPVAGVTFTVRGADGPTITTEPTGPDGKAIIPNLLPGVYTVTEQSVPENYILDAGPQTVTLLPNREAMVCFQDHQRPTLKIAKVDINGRPLTGVIFEVKTKAGVKIGDFPVDADGAVTVPQKHLSEGYFIITEKQAPKGYILDATPREVYLRPGLTTEIRVENQKKPSLTIQKIDSVVGSGIQGARFEIYVSKDRDTDGTYQKLADSLYSDENGFIRLEELDTGWYKIVEVEPAAGFTMKEPAQQTVYLEHDKDISVVFENVPKSAIGVEKYDSVTGEALAGCTFQLKYLGGASGTGGTVIGQKVTGKNGSALWTGLKPGAYIIEEIDSADGYSILQASETVFLADDGEQSVVTVRFANAPDGILLIRKVCATNPSVTLQNAKFKVTYADGTLIGDSNGIYRTDENGEIRIPGLKPGKSVVVTETKAPDGFLIDTQSQTAQIKEGKMVSLTFKNQPKGALIIQKRDSQTNAPLSGAEFRVTTAAGCEVGLDGVIGTSTLTSNGIFTTDAQGEIRISNLAPGAYVLTEIKAPAGYVMDAPSTNVVIGQGGDTQTVVIKNTSKGNLVIEKYDSVTKQLLSGAEFRITTASGELTADNEGLTSSNGIYTTDENGQIVLSKLLPDTYIVAETKAPDHYQMAPKPQTVVVNAGDTQTIRFYNDPLCTLTLLKRDAVTRKPLKGAEFTVKDAEGRNIGRFVTGTDGTVTVTGLAPDSTVVVSESKAPAGYIKDETPKIIVVRSGAANSLTFDDEPATTLIIRKFVEGTMNEPLSGVAFKVVDGSGAAVGPDDGIYYTDKAGEIVLEGIEPGTTVIAREIKSVEGYVLDGTP